jgi:hypothetical protein
VIATNLHATGSLVACAIQVLRVHGAVALIRPIAVNCTTFDLLNLKPFIP